MEVRPKQAFPRTFPMIRAPRKLYPYAMLMLVGLVTMAFSVTPTVALDDIRMCSSVENQLSCPTDNPVFDKDAQTIFVSVNSADMVAGQEIRFTWYKIDDSELFSSYLATDYQTALAAPTGQRGGVVTASFPASLEITPGSYEVVIHPPNDGKPVIKTFKVLD